jgi:peptide/nickel transport system substrate-binding protein
MFAKYHAQSCSITLLLVSLLALLMSACNAPQPPPTVKPAVGGIWIDDLYGDPDSLIPNGTLKNASAMVDQALYTPLFYGDANGTLHPGLATELPTVKNGGISSDLKTWTFHLRPHLQWSDGAVLDANDVDYTWRLWDNPLFGAASTYGFSLISSAQISPDNLSITFQLKQPFAPFASLWADGLFAPLPAHYFSTMLPNQILRSADNLAPTVTSGPFMMNESLPGNHYIVIRNPRYYLASEHLPYLDKVIFRVAPNPQKELIDFQNGSVDSAWFVDAVNPAPYRKLTHYTLSTNTKSTDYEALYFNFHNTLLAKNPNVRTAIAMAINHAALIKNAREGQGVLLCTDHSAALQPGYQVNAPCPRFDVRAANALLDQDGWVLGINGYRSKNGQKLEFKYSTTQEVPWRLTDETLIQQELQATGIKLDIQNYPALTLYSSVLVGGVPGTYDIAEIDNSLNYDADDAALLACNQFPPNGFNIDFYCNSALDALYALEQSTIDPAARQAIFNSIHQIYLTDFPFIPLYAETNLAIAKKGTHNYDPAPEGALETINIWQWWCDNGHCPTEESN